MIISPEIQKNLRSKKEFKELIQEYDMDQAAFDVEPPAMRKKKTAASPIER